MRHSLYVIGLGILFFLTNACTRATDNNTRLSLTLPSVGEGAQSATSQLGYLVINVSGPGIPNTLVFPFDRKDDQAVSNSVVIEIPAGENRLVQALAVYFDDVTKKFSFYYGDSTASLSGASASLALQVSSVTGAENAVSGRVSGRYWNASSVAPSGEVSVKYDPGSSKPQMIVERGFIVNGWFSLFGLAGVPLKYEIEGTGEVLFGGVARKLDDTYFGPSTSVLVAQIPIHQREEDGDFYLEEPSYHVIGWFGNTPAALKVCYPTAGSFVDLRTAQDSNDILDSLTYTSSFSLITTEAMFNSNTDAAYFNGGVDSGSCSGLVDYEEAIFATIEQFDGQGNDEATGFRVPLQKDSSGDFITFPNGSSGYLNLAGKLLPGTQNTFYQVQVFKKVGSSAYTDEFDSEHPFPCLEMPSRGYVLAGSDVVDPSSRVFEVSDVINSSTDLSAGVAVGICFANSSGQRAPRGGFIPAYELSGGGGGGSFATSLSISINEGLVAGSSLCLSGSVNYLDSNGAFVDSAGATGSLILSSQIGEVLFFDESDTTCTAGSTTKNLDPSDSKFRYKASGTLMAGDPDTIQASVSVNGTSISGSKNVKGVSSGDMVNLDVNGAATVSNPGFCKSLLISAKTESNGTVATETGALTLGLSRYDGSSTSTSEIAFYNSSTDCSSNLTPMVNATLGLAAGLKEIWVKNTVANQYKLQVSYTSAQSISFVRSVFINAVPSGAATKVILAQLSAPSESRSGQCQHFRVSLQNDMSALVNASGLASINMNWSTGTLPSLYTDSSCLSPLGGSELTFSAESSKDFYMRANHSYSTFQNLQMDAFFHPDNGNSNLWSQTSGFANPLAIDPWMISSNYAGGPMTVGTCYPYNLGFGTTPAYSGDRGNSSGDSVGIFLSVPGAATGTQIQFYSEPSCTTVLPASTVVFAPAEQAKTIYLKALTSFTGGAMVFSSPSLTNGLQIGSPGSSIYSPPIVSPLTHSSMPPLSAIRERGVV